MKSEMHNLALRWLEKRKEQNEEMLETQYYKEVKGEGKMTMSEILKELKKNYNGLLPGRSLAESRLASCEKEVEEANKRLEKAKDDLKRMNDMLESVKMSIESLEIAGFKPELFKEEKEEKVEVDPRHKGAFILQMNEYDNVIDRFKNQREASEKIGVSQSAVCYRMKKSKDLQIKSYGTYLAWEY